MIEHREFLRTDSREVDGCKTINNKRDLLQALMRGEKAIREGRTLSHEQAMEKLSRWLK